MIFGLFFGLELVRGAPVLSVSSLLRQPIAARTQLLSGANARQLAELERIAFTRTESLETRWRAITTMGRLDPKRFEPALARALTRPEWFVRNAALVAVLSARPEFAIEVSSRALDDAALMVRTQAVRNLIHFDARASAPKLWRALDDRRNFSARGESLWIRAHIAEALVKFSTSGRTVAFRRLLDDPDERLHVWAVRGLEASSGLRLTDESEGPETARRKWRARVGDQTI